MDLYLPIANLSVNALVIVLLGGGVGLLSGMFGVGGGFLTTPLLIVYGIPPTVAAASAASQVTGASVSGVFAYWRRGGVDFKMGGVLVAGGVVGSLAGAWVFRLLQAAGQLDTVIAVVYVLMLGSVGGLMAKESLQAIGLARRGEAARPSKRRHHPLVAALPFRTRFYRSGLYISPLAPLLLGFATGVLTVMLGIGGGFILVPAMIYLLGMTTGAVVGTSLFQILFVTAAATMIHATTTKAVDIVLAALLLVGSVVGAQVGVRIAGRMKPEWLRLALAAIVLVVAARILLGLVWRPAEIYSVELAVKRLVAVGLLLLTAQAKPVLVPDVSQRTIRIVYSFTGADLLLFGAILYPGGRQPKGEKPVDIVVVVKGPTESVLVREKERMAGIWVNADRLRYRSAPSFYAIASSRPIDRVVDDRTRAIYELGLDSLQLSPASNAAADEQERFQQGMVDLKRRTGLYFADRHAVEITGGVLYRARVAIPARVPVGRYTAETFLIRDGRVLAAATTGVDIQKAGFERFVARAADRWSFTYGLTAVALSVFLGWAAGAIARRI